MNLYISVSSKLVRIRLPKIFISHSRNDTETLNFFDSIFAGAAVEAVRVEFEKYDVTPSHYIQQQVYSSDGLFVLLGPNVEFTEYTRNWVAFEVGLAAAGGKDIWVFEPVDTPVQFPVPSLHHYVLYNLNEKVSRDYITSIVRAYQVWVPLFRQLPVGVMDVKCQYENCQATFRLHSDVQSFNCPTCRKSLVRNTSDTGSGENNNETLDRTRMGWRY